MSEEFLRTPEAAAYLNMSRAWLKANRREKSGADQVPFVRIGARVVVYRKADLDAFVASRVKPRDAFDAWPDTLRHVAHSRALLDGEVE